MDVNKIMGRIIANTYYEFQKVRIASMNWIRDVMRKTIEGIDFDEVEEKKEEKDFKKKYTDKFLLEQWDLFLQENKITKEEHDHLKKCLDIMEDAKKIEGKYKRMMAKFIEDEIVYNEFLSKVRGMGPVLSTNIVKEFGDCSQYETVSKLWAHTGNHVVNGKAPKKQKGVTLNFSPNLRMLTWKISDSLMKSNKGYYRGIYDTEKEKHLNREYEVGFLEEKFGKPYKTEDINISKGHAHNRALRKMRKLFLSHYWEASRELAGLSTVKTYVEGVLNHDHIISWKRALELEGELSKE